MYRSSILLIALIFSCSTVAQAGECPVTFGGDLVGDAYSGKVTDAVNGMYKQSGCEAAAHLASSCAMGSSIDLSFLGAAAEHCAAEFKNKPADQARYKKELARCAKDKSGGTLGMSVRAGCVMEAARVIARQASCEEAAAKIAKINLDFLAAQLNFSGSQDSGDATFVKTGLKGLYVYRVDGMIYKGPYAIEVATDTACNLASVKLDPLEN